MSARPIDSYSDVRGDASYALHQKQQFDSSVPIGPRSGIHAKTTAQVSKLTSANPLLPVF